jgi:hypothetical protein
LRSFAALVEKEHLDLEATQAVVEILAQLVGLDHAPGVPAPPARPVHRRRFR